MDPERFVSMLEGNHNNDICSTDNFLTHMPPVAGGRRCYEIPQTHMPPDPDSPLWYEILQTTEENGQLTVFRYPPATTNGPNESIEEKIIKYFLGNKTSWSKDSLVQLWTPRRSSSGQTVLTTSDQPFGLGCLYNGLCKYRYYCIQLEDLVEDITQLGPLGRVFTRGHLEYCPNVRAYSIQEFPMRSYAVACGITRYWALPLFERGRGRGGGGHCVGVLECVSLAIPFLNVFEIIPKELQVLGLECPDYDHSGECFDSRVKLLYSHPHIGQVVKSLEKEHELPLTQVWVPCMCNDEFSNSNAAETSRVNNTQLFPHFIRVDCNLKYATEIDLAIMDKYCSGKSGKSLVWTAYLQNRCCFGDTSQFSIPDYPLIPLTRSSGLTSCFAIPLQLIHPNLPPGCILEVFPPAPQQRCDDPEAVLKSLLSTITPNDQEEFSVTRSSHSDSDDLHFVYFNVCPGTKSSNEEAPGEVHEHQNSQTSNFTQTTGQLLQVPSENFGGHDIDSQPQDKGHEIDSGNVFTNRSESITYDDLIQNSGKTLDEAAGALGVSRSTLKRVCRKPEFNIKRWPLQKRNKFQGFQSNPATHVHPSSSVEVSSGEVTQDHHETGQLNSINIPPRRTVKGKSVARRDKKTNNSYTMTVKATYRGDIVLFPLSRSKSRMKELREKLDKRFELSHAIERYKIKYEYNGDWIMIACDEDLCSRMDTLKSSGEITMNLSVFLPTA